MVCPEILAQTYSIFNLDHHRKSISIFAPFLVIVRQTKKRDNRTKKTVS